jgi:hypothetical protein
MRALLTAVLVLGAARGAVADDTFEAKATGARRVRHIDDLVWAFAAPCDAGNDTHQRQCRRLRDTRAAQLANATLLVEADRDAFVVGAFSPQKKSIELVLSACVSCKGVDLDGKKYFVVANKDGSPAPKFEGGKLRAASLFDNARTFPNQAAADKFTASTKAAKVQMLVKVPAKPAWNDGDKRGIALELIGYRVYSPCDGNVVIASPKSAAGDVDKKACSAASK